MSSIIETFIPVLTEIILGTAIVLMCLVAVFAKKSAAINRIIAALAVLLSIAMVVMVDASGFSFHRLIFNSIEHRIFQLLFLVSGFFVILQSTSYLKHRQVDYAEYYVLVIGAVFGGIIALNTVHFLTMLIGLETMSLASYMLCAIDRENRQAVEAAFKYFIIGALSTALIVFGIALIYGSSGLLEFGARAIPIGKQNISEHVMYLWGGGLFIIGLAAKLAAAPLHFWASDVYQGAPTPVSVFIMVAPKIVLFSILFQFSQTLLGSWDTIVLILANLSLVIGNAMALRQTQIKRLLAFSSVSHVGYLLLGVVFLNRDFQTLAYYLLAYALANFGLFGVLLYLFIDRSDLKLTDLRGLFKRAPGQTIFLSLFVISLAGIPLTPGFIGKLLLFSRLVEGNIYQMIFALLNSAVGAIYYLKLISYCFKPSEEGEEIEFGKASMTSKFSVGLALLGSVLVIIWPFLIKIVS